METIKNYLESMFASLPNTPDVKRAKAELLSMMEDKYQELISEGKSENEAIGIVISEFGNLDELAETLGIETVIEDAEDVEYRHISLEEVKQYIADKTRQHFYVGFGVFLCIASPIPAIITSIGGEVLISLGLCFLFVMVAAAVGLFIFAGVRKKEWSFITSEPCSIDYATADYVHNEQEYNKPVQVLMLIIGIALCVLCVVPVIIMSLIPVPFLSECVGPSMLLSFVAIGVLLIIASGGKESAYRTLLALNDRGTVSGNYESVRSADSFSGDGILPMILSVYWNTVTCIYFIWSFLSFDWYITWIIWPIAGIVWKLLQINTGEEKGGE